MGYTYSNDNANSTQTSPYQHTVHNENLVKQSFENTEQQNLDKPSFLLKE